LRAAWEDLGQLLFEPAVLAIISARITGFFDSLASQNATEELQEFARFVGLLARRFSSQLCGRAWG